jgi:tRNA (mo5U34)-methyltransferase
LGSRAEFHEMSVYELNRESLGTFEIVLFLGVLYHLPDPFLALRRVCEMTRETAVIE